jgi:hypothetical protein
VDPYNELMGLCITVGICSLVLGMLVAPILPRCGLKTALEQCTVVGIIALGASLIGFIK